MLMSLLGGPSLLAASIFGLCPPLAVPTPR